MKIDTAHLPIKISFEQTPKHTKDLMRTHTRSSKYYWVWIVLAVVMILVFATTIFSAERPQQMLMSYAIAVVPIGIIWYVIIRIAKRNQSRNKELYGHRTMTFDLDQIHIKTAVSSTIYAWDAVVKKVESSLSYFLYISSIQALIVPKDAFQTEADRTTFEELCAIKIGGQERTINALIDKK